MNRKELFFRLLEEELSKEKFKYFKSKNAFIKKENGNEFIFEYDLWDDFYMVESKLNVLIGEIENIKKMAWGKIYNKFMSLGRVKSYLIDDPTKGQVLTDTKNNVIKAVKVEITFFHSFAKKYFIEALDYSLLDKKLNLKPGDELYLSHNPIQTSFLAIIVAKLVGNENLISLCEFYRGIILKFDDAFVDDYDLLADYLIRKHHIN